MTICTHAPSAGMNTMITPSSVTAVLMDTKGLFVLSLRERGGGVHVPGTRVRSFSALGIYLFIFLFIYLFIYLLPIEPHRVTSGLFTSSSLVQLKIIYKCIMAN